MDIYFKIYALSLVSKYQEMKFLDHRGVLILTYFRMPLLFFIEAEREDIPALN